MRLPATWPRHRARWIAAVVGLLVLALLIALAVHVHALLQPQRFTSVLERDLAAVGIKLDLEAPATPALFPRPAVRLQDFSLTNAGATTPVLRASGATIVVPWRTLLHGGVAIERVEVDAPRIDLGQLRALLARLPRHRGPPRLPTIATGVHMSHGTVSNGGAPLLFEVGLDTGELVPGRPFRMDVSARGASGREISASLETVPSSPHDGTIDFNPIRLAFEHQGGATVQLAGHGDWQGGETLALDLAGSLRHQRLGPPPAAASAGAPAGAATSGAASAHAAAVVDKLSLQVQPAQGHTPITLVVKLDGEDTHVDMRMLPTEFGAWWQRLLAASPEQPPGRLPLSGRARIQTLDLGWLKASGVSIDAGPDLAPAAAASAAAPATSTSTH